MADPRISEDLIIDIGRRVSLIEDKRDEANSDLKSIWSDAREQFRAAGLVGAEISKEVALLKGAVAETRLAEADKTKRSEKADGIDSYLAILTSPRARARARRDKSEPLLPPVAQEGSEIAVADGNSSGRTESSEDGQTPVRGAEEMTASSLAKDMRDPEQGVQISRPGPVYHEGAAATETAPDYLREPAAVVPGQIIREGDAPRETGRLGGDASGPDTESQAKATKGKPGMAEGEALVRSTTAGTVLQVGAADAVQPATSEIMDATGGESAATNFHADLTDKPVGEHDGSPAAPARAKTPDEIADGMGLPRSIDPRCQKPHICGRSSHLGLCADCRGESAVAA